jgi:hypothetical protein
MDGSRTLPTLNALGSHSPVSCLGAEIFARTTDAKVEIVVNLARRRASVWPVRLDLQGARWVWCSWQKPVWQELRSEAILGVVVRVPRSLGAQAVNSKTFDIATEGCGLGGQICHESGPAAVSAVVLPLGFERSRTADPRLFALYK